MSSAKTFVTTVNGKMAEFNVEKQKAQKSPQSRTYNRSSLWYETCIGLTRLVFGLSLLAISNTNCTYTEGTPFGGLYSTIEADLREDYLFSKQINDSAKKYSLEQLKATDLKNYLSIQNVLTESASCPKYYRPVRLMESQHNSTIYFKYWRRTFLGLGDYVDGDIDVIYTYNLYWCKLDSRLTRFPTDVQQLYIDEVAQENTDNESGEIWDDERPSIDCDTKLYSFSLVQAALDKASTARTTVIVAHRLSTVANADRIVVMKHGTIVEQGSPNELLERRGAYWTMVQRQNGLLDKKSE